VPAPEAQQSHPVVARRCLASTPLQSCKSKWQRGTERRTKVRQHIAICSLGAAAQPTQRVQASVLPSRWLWSTVTVLSLNRSSINTHVGGKQHQQAAHTTNGATQRMRVMLHTPDALYREPPSWSRVHRRRGASSTGHTPLLNSLKGTR